MYEDMQPVELEHEGTLLRGYAALPDGTGRFPAVLVMHTALGITHAMNEPVARALAAEGYSAFCTDMYGVGRSYNENHGKPDKERARTVAWFDAIAARPDVDEERIAAIGFCYGGMTALELARSGANLRAAVSYHGVLTTDAPAEVGAIRGHVVAYCGAGDPFCPVEDVEVFRDEMRDAEVSNYQTTIFGAALHGFTDPNSEPANLEGIQYDELSNALSWSGTLVLLRHLFGS
jgi:dienelactone hydrolase